MHVLATPHSDTKQPRQFGKAPSLPASTLTHYHKSINHRFVAINVLSPKTHAHLECSFSPLNVDVI